MEPNASIDQASQPHLLIVDDDPEIRALIVRYFGGHGFRVSTANDGAAMRTTIAEQAVDIVLLDLGLSGEDGLELTRYLRAHWTGAIVIVTGRGESVDKVVGLELGADDYVAKPFDLRELLARVRSVLRRISPPRARSTDANAMEFAGFRFDAQMRSLQGRGGDPIQLTTGEYELLVAFLSAPGRVLSRDQLVSQLHGHEAGPFDRSIDVQVGRLRRKIERDAANPELIKSVRGAGYVFTPRVQRV
ncbi:MAG TPA: response regulator [Rudaea sp.]|nr:response regulator [Rudaea sp.]